MSTRDERKQRSRESILESAARLMRQRGLAGAHLGEIMQGAGLTVGGFYAHFASKDALMDATLRQTCVQLRARLLEGIEALPIGERLPAVLGRYLSPAHRDAPAQGCPLPAVVGEVGTTAEAHRAVLQEQLERFVEELGAPLPAPPGLSPRALALGLIALMYGGLSLSRALQGTPLSDEILQACRALGAQAADPATQQRPAGRAGEARGEAPSPEERR
jgi:TetR/AcrR family transcriptional repressor of nem operon